MDATPAIKRQLLAEKGQLKQRIIDNLVELYFLKHNGLMCDFQSKNPKEPFSNSLIQNIKDDDITNDQKFYQLLNLKFEEITQTSSANAPIGTRSSSVSAPESLRAAGDSHIGSNSSEKKPQTTSASISSAKPQAAGKTLDSSQAAVATTTITPTATTLSSSSTTPTATTTTTLPTQPVVDLSTANDECPTSPRSTTSSSRPGSPSKITPTANSIPSNVTPNSRTAPTSPSSETNCTSDVSKRKRSVTPEKSLSTSEYNDSISHPPEKKTRDASPTKRDDVKVAQLNNSSAFSTSDTQTMEVDDVEALRTPDIVTPLSPSKRESPTRISKVVESMVTPSATSAETTQRQIYERARHEAEVTARIAELRKQGLWTARRLPKLQEPPRPKVHWDYLLEEMRWLSADFEAERKWKRKVAKKCAYNAVRYLHEKKSSEERAKREEMQLKKKVAASYAKEIKSFWSTIEKIVDFRQQTKLEETRKKAWGLHLNYILDQTSKFSNNCLEETNNTPAIAMEVDYPKSQDGEKIDTKESVINNEEQTKSKQKVDDMTAGAESIQPKGNTLETTTVSTKVPFLLKHSLREYQHIGLDWLVAMYKKQLNGILADEMGLGKTIQTIALLAHLACEEQEWGPHLIVVPTSVMLNWEMEFKKWCPAFKILTYYGNPKERRLKRVGWSRPNSFHVCITSYRIVIQDHAAFRRKQWCYFILDEAHYIKNFKSQRWQMLLNFNSQRRLLLTGTPLQNDLMELWSLMHFLMPSLFDSYREFKDWFVNPLTGMVEGSQEYNEELVERLHKILRPFLLRRLKADVEKQLPSKREIIRYCRLSKRQRFLYEEFMSLTKTKETLASGNFLSVINVLMQLRKVCNHPNLFEPRPTVSPFMMGGIAFKIPGILTTPLDYDPERHINLANLQLLPISTGSSLTSSAYQSIKSRNPTLENFLSKLDTDDVSESSCSTIEDGESTVTGEDEVDEIAEAVGSSDIIDAYSKVKEIRREEKKQRLTFVAQVNERRCTKASSMYFSDLKDRLYLNCLNQLSSYESNQNVFSCGNSRALCSLVHEIKNQPRAKLNLLSSLLNDAVKTPEQRVEEMSELIDRYVFCVPGASASPISLHVSHLKSTKKVQEVYMRESLYDNLSPKFNFLSKIMKNMRTSFPELRLIEYDCGKLQTLGRLLNELRSNDHRVLIFTQMSRMLDILEQFLNYHGHTYLRLDGATKIDQRQILMERFNSDKRIFCFILSTRSGGIGVNLTGADTVIFYDSDWNPTMDAQAQDRCHRIGQTRDVYIYRLICEDTIERNIYMKAQQKRMLGDLAIEDGNFNTSSLKRHSIQELFEPNKEPIELDKDIEATQQSNELTKAQLNKLELALSKGEVEAGEDMDVDAIKVAKTDVDTDLREFDESIPLTEENSPIEKSEKEQQIDIIVSRMTPVEQYAVRFLESLQKPKNQEELEQAEKEYRQELELKKSQWEQSRIDMLKEQSTKNVPISETMLTYPRGAKCEHVHYLLDGEKKVEEMPLWAPPTPPTSPPSPVEDNNQYHYQPPMTPAMAARINAMGGLGNIFGVGSDSNKSDMRQFIDEKDLHVDYINHFFYEPNVMLESQLPPVNHQYTDNETTSYTIGSKKIRLTGTPVVPGGYYQTPSQLPHLQQHLQNLTNIPTTPDGSGSAVLGQPGQRKPKVRRDEVICLPKSLFDRQTPNFAKIRRELKLQKLRCVTKGNDSDPFAMQKFFHSFSMNPLGQSLQQETIVTTVYRQMQQFNNPNILLAYHQDQLPGWTIQEEWASIMIIQHLQDLPVNLCILTPGHTPNWELVSEVVSDVGFAHRSFKMCEYHFALNVQKREMTRDSSWDERALPSSQSSDSSQPPTKKAKKHKNQQAAPATTTTDAQTPNQPATSSKGNSAAVQTVPFKPSKTGALLVHDKSLAMSLGDRYDTIKRIRHNRPKPIRSRFASRERIANNPSTLVRNDNRLIYYDRPLKPEAVILSLRGAFRAQ